MKLEIGYDKNQIRHIRFLCEHCNHVILNYHSAIVKWDTSEPSDAFVCHKGSCDLASRGSLHRHPVFGWTMLDKFLDDLKADEPISNWRLNPKEKQAVQGVQ